jgi:hypothetical protein
MIDTAPALHNRVKTSLPPGYEKLGRSSSGSLSTFLGLFSVGLGLWEILDPRGVARTTGTPYPGLIRAYGFRELLSGVGILMDPKPAEGLWSRVAGDLLDLATLGAAYAQGNPDEKRKTLLAAGAVLGVTALDVLASTEHTVTD